MVRRRSFGYELYICYIGVDLKCWVAHDMMHLFEVVSNCNGCRSFVGPMYFLYHCLSGRYGRRPNKYVV